MLSWKKEYVTSESRSKFETTRSPFDYECFCMTLVVHVFCHMCVWVYVCVCVCLSVMCTTVVWQRSDISCSDILSQFISPASEWTEALEGHSSTSNANLSFCQHQWRALQYISHRHTYTQMHTCIIFFSILLLFDVKWHSDCEVQTVRFNLLSFHDKLDWTAKKNINFLSKHCFYWIFTECFSFI